MPSKVWQSGEELKAVDLNNYLQNQVVMTFADSTARTAAIPTPTVGMISYLTGTGYLEIFTDKTSPPSWRPPWSSAWGLTYNSAVTDKTLTSGYTFIHTNIPIQVPGRYYKVEFDTNISVGGGSATWFRFRFQNGASLDLIGEWAHNAGWGLRCLLHDYYVGAPSNNLGVICQADAPVTTNWARVRVFDMGPV
jgi:hypothetical protein